MTIQRFPLACLFRGDKTMKRIGIVTMMILVVAFLTSMFPLAALAANVPKDRVVVMYFHRTERCPTCIKMGEYTEEAVIKGLTKEEKEGKVSLHFIDFQDPKNAAFVQAYGITGPTLIVARASGDKVAEYKNLTEMWVKSRDKDAFLEYVKTNVNAYLKPVTPVKNQ